MYTEENDFDYNDYDDYDEVSYNNKNKFNFDKGLIIKITLIILCIVLVIFLVFKLKNLNSNNKTSNTDSIFVFNTNVSNVQDAAYKYFFKDNNLPDNFDSINVNSLISKGYLTEVLDNNGNSCGYNTSYVSLDKNTKDYKMEIHLACPSIEKSVTYYYDMDGKCLTCNGENYTPSSKLEDDNTNQDNNSSNNNENNSNNNKDDNANSNDNDNNENNNSLNCSTWSSWTDEYIVDANMETESRKVVIGYKDGTIYGDWTAETTDVIEGTDTLEVFSETRKEIVRAYEDNWIETTDKPEEKEGREIQSSSTKKCSSYKNKVVSTYTKTLSYRDPKAKSCSIKAIGQVECTYEKVEKVCSSYKTVTSYKYRDLVEKEIEVTYYKSRTVIKGEPLYTEYMLESELPEGYTVLDGSEKTQYRYKEKCGK